MVVSSVIKSADNLFELVIADCLAFHVVFSDAETNLFVVPSESKSALNLLDEVICACLPSKVVCKFETSEILCVCSASANSSASWETISPMASTASFADLPAEAFVLIVLISVMVSCLAFHVFFSPVVTNLFVVVESSTKSADNLCVLSILSCLPEMSWCSVKNSLASWITISP